MECRGMYDPKAWIWVLVCAWIWGQSVGVEGAEEDQPYPAEAAVVSIRDFGAKGDGVTDDTEPFRRAVALGTDDQRFVYIPNGTYLLSDTIGWSRRRTMMGHSRDRVVLKLKDRTPAFSDPRKPKPLIHAAVPGNYYGHDSWVNAAFDNYLQNLTIDTGKGNPGAVALRYTTHNNGMIENMTILSGDGAGVIGLDLSQTEFGPGMIRDLLVEGFDIGIKTPGQVSNAVLENISLRNQKVVGFENQHPVAIENLRSNNRVPAIRSTGGAMSHLVLINADLTGGSSDHVAIDCQGSYYLRNIRQQGYAVTPHDPKIRLPVDHRIGGTTHGPDGKFPRSLGLAIEQPPQIFQEPVSRWRVIKPSGGDDTDMIQEAMNSRAATIFFSRGEYRVHDTIHVPPTVRRVLSVPGATLRGGKVVFGIGDLQNPSYPGGGGNRPFFRIEGQTPSPISFERVAVSAWPHRVNIMEIASSRPVLIRHSIAGHPGGEVRTSEEAGEGRLFLLESSPDLRITRGYRVWARQYNPENNPFNPKSATMKNRTYIVNDGGMLWVLGWKTESPAIHAMTRNGGMTEVLGGFFRDHFGGEEYGGDIPYFISQDAATSAMYVQYAWAHGKARGLHAVIRRDGMESQFRLSPDTRTVGLLSTVGE